MSLEKYKEKRNFKVSPEPSGKSHDAAGSHHDLLYVIQKHRASQLHYDFRLEFKGVLLSWAVPKGPSLDPSAKRLAMQVEDHPLEYGNFEGVIPEGEYGGGTVMVWDNGKWIPESDDIGAALQKGDLKFNLEGKKLRGSWVLVRTHGFGSKPDKSWLLIKHRDKYASDKDITTSQPRSVLSERLLADIARDNGGDVEKAATGDPGKVAKSKVGTTAKNPIRKKRAKT
jgi:bifunctional non-homologous end joining protein LigD